MTRMTRSSCTASVVVIFFLVFTSAVAFVPKSRKQCGFYSFTRGKVGNENILETTRMRMSTENPSELSTGIADMLATAQAMNSKPPPPDEVSALPEVKADGVHYIVNDNQYRNFLEANSNKLVIVKFSAPWCRACKSLALKLPQVYRDETLVGMPVVFGEFSALHNQDYIRTLNVSSLPSMHFYTNGFRLVENFACGPNVMSFLELKNKIFKFVENCADLQTNQVRVSLRSKLNHWIKSGLRKMVGLA